MRSSSGIHVAVTLFAALNILDIASTHLALKAGLSEGNHIPSLVLSMGGESAMYLFKAAISLLVISAVLRLSPYFRRLAFGLQAANGVLAAIVLLNLTQLLLA